MGITGERYFRSQVPISLYVVPIFSIKQLYGAWHNNDLKTSIFIDGYKMETKEATTAAMDAPFFDNVEIFDR